MTIQDIPRVEGRPTRRGPVDDGQVIVNLSKIIRRRIWIFSAIAMTTFVLVVAVALVIKPMYLARSGIKLDPNQRGALDATAVAPGTPPDSAIIDTEISTLKSREVALGVVARLNLIRDPEFNPPASKRSVFPAREAPPAQAEQVTDGVAAALMRNVSVGREGVSYIVNIDVKSEDPAKAARIANAYASEYIAYSQRQKIAAAQAQQDALGGRASELQQQAEIANEAVARYRAGAGIVDSGGASGTVTDQQAAGLASQLSIAASDAAAASSKARAARSQVARGDLDAVSEVLASPVVTDLRRQRTEIVREQAQINSRYGPRHPESVRVETQLSRVDAAIQSESQRIVSGLQSEADAASARVGSLQAQLGRLEGRQASNARANVEAQSLQQKADSLASLANSTTQVVQRAGQQAQVGEVQARIATLASQPATPAFPNKPLFAVLGLVLGGILGAAVIFVLEVFDNSVRTVDDVETGLGVPYIASVPLVPRSYTRETGHKSRPWSYLIAKPVSGYAESLRSVRSALLLSSGGAKVVTVTSALPGEGKTSTAASLALVMAMSGGRVLLIDGDLRRNALRWLLPAAPVVGLLEVLSEGVSVESAIVKGPVQNLDILPLTKPSFTPAEAFGGAAMKALLDTLRTRYDHIIIDAPPLLAVADARLLAAQSDAVLMVLRWGKTPTQASKAAITRLIDDGSTIAGVVMTMVNVRARAFVGQDDSSYYYKAYGRYYQD